MRTILGLLVIAALSGTQSASADERARVLHDTYCVMCHDTRAYPCSERLAQNHAEIRAQVDRWQENISLNWSTAEIDLMTNHLARRDYKVPCPAACQARMSGTS